ncbi:GNAT family N-acetyltransferase [Halalkalibacterium ligniniphilum]|uniref:GNAT family N-acetyltransferase n=1 Tax=Halalkalibacterium ligniniphilum TaxID=1134413 RepID=UPI00034ADDEF|nr:GNAT family N-acetyltransferase [Halalkalibacterium ligniniphilum]
MLIRKAKPKDSDTLSNLAYKSKSYWGYSKDFLKRSKDDLTVTGEYIEQNPVYLMEKDNKIVAFYNFEVKNKKLEALFIDPDYIGKGIGKLLWLDLLGKAKELNIKEFTLDSEPNAEGFYLKMGANKIGYTSSTVFPNRNLPLMKVKVMYHL